MLKIKKTLAFLIVCALLITSIAAVSAAPSLVNGDADNSGSVNSGDVLAIRKHVANIKVTINHENADVNSDKKINAIDVLKLRKHLANIEKLPTKATPTLPTEPTTPKEPYPNVLSTQIAIDQIGYNAESEKVAIFFEPMIDENSDRDKSLIHSAQVQLVEKSTGKVVLTGTTTTRGNHTTSENYISKFNFSSVKTPGTYIIKSPIGYSYDIVISNNPYKEAEDAIVTALYYNRCGTALDSKIVGDFYAHDVCHDGDVPVYIYNKAEEYTDGGDVKTRYVVNETAKASDFAGGLHDAGDYGRYTTPAVQVVADLIYSYYMFPNALNIDIVQDNANENIADVLDQARYEAEFLTKMVNDKGGVYWRIVTNKFAMYEHPDKDTYFKNEGLHVSREMYEATTATAGALASTYTAFKDIDPDFAQLCLDKAKLAYEYAITNTDTKWKKEFTAYKEFPSIAAGSYGGGAGTQGLWYAACALYAATGESKYNDKVKEMIAAKTANYVNMTAYDSGGYGSLAYLFYDKGDKAIKDGILASFKASADSTKNVAARDGFYSTINTEAGYVWGSNAKITNSLKICAITDFFNKTNDYESTVRNTLSFMFGRNWSGYSFVTGFGSKTPMNIHHRPAMIGANKGIAPMDGWVVGGFVNKSYYDDNNNYATNEICVYWNTSPMYALAYIVEKDLKN